MNNSIYNKLIFTIITILIIYLSSVIIRKIIDKKVSDVKIKHLTRRWIRYARVIFIIIILMIIWVEDTGSITSFIGFLSAGIALALHQAIMNIVGWMVIIIKKPYEIGDRIECEKIKGDVIDVRMFYTVLMEVGNWVGAEQSTGRIVSIPNGKIFTKPFFNYTSGFNALWDEINILITYDSDKDRAKEIILKIANESMDKKIFGAIKRQKKEMSKKYAIKSGKLTPIIYFSIKESGVQIELRYLSYVRKRRNLNNIISEKIYDAFLNEPNIEFAYPSQKIFYSEDK